jgi:transposase-like protein
MVRNSLKFVLYKDRKEVAGDLKKIYTSTNEEMTKKKLNTFKEKWNNKYPTIADSWDSTLGGDSAIFSFSK